MAQFHYEVRDSNGKLIKGQLETVNRERAVRQLQDLQYTVVVVAEMRPPWSPVADFRRAIHRLGYERVGLRDVALFTRQLALLMAAGVPIVKALEGLRDQVWASPYLNVVCEDLLKWVHEGNRLSVALLQHPRIFSETYVSLVRAGEASGTVVEILDRLSSYMERNYRLTQKLQSALVYPALVFTLSLVLVFLMCSYILPMFLSFFEGMALRMPAATRGLIAVAASLGNPWVVSAFALCIPLVLYQIHLMSKISTIRIRIENSVLGFPVFGKLFVQVVSARFCRTASILLDCGLGQMQSLDLLGDVVGSTVVSAEVEEMRANIRDGHGTFSSELLHTTFFPPICGHMLCAAEESGTMPQIFARLADFFDESVEDGITRVLALIEPLMLGVMGCIVGVILLSVFQPIYALLENL
ncbi:type II secretion system F family protein [bacterium]|nr:type II secretion system F family protein [bacterium]